MRLQNSERATLLILSLALMGCDPQEPGKPLDTTPDVSASGAASASKPVPIVVTAEDLDALSHRKAKELLIARGWKSTNASTGPNVGAFSMRTSKEDGTKLQLEMFVFDKDIEVKFGRPRAIKDAAYIEHGMKILSVRVKKDDKLDEAASKALIEALALRARDPAEPFALVKPKSDSWLEPSIETVDSHLVISPKLVDKTVAALTELGVEGASKGGEQKRNLKDDKDTGHPGVTIRARQGEDNVVLDFRCLPESTGAHFWPKPDDADLGEAIYTQERCKVVLSVKGPKARWSDKDKAQALLEKLFAHQPKG